MAGFGYDPIDEFDTKVQTVFFLCILDKIYMDWKLYLVEILEHACSMSSVLGVFFMI